MTTPDTIPIPEGLSKAEAAVYRLVVQGYTSAEISRQLCRSSRTVEVHRYSIAKKLGRTGPRLIVWHYTSFVPSLAKGVA